MYHARKVQDGNLGRRVRVCVDNFNFWQKTNKSKTKPSK